MNIIQIDETNFNRLASLVAEFRVTLRSYKGIVSEPDPEEGREDLQFFQEAGYPIFAAEEAGRLTGYIVCRIEGSLLWVEQIYACEDCRRRGVASLLFAKAEELARSLGEETVFNYVHPNNDGMIAFLRSKGYTVLNLIEIRKPFPGEKLTTKISVDNQSFDY
ncbi:MAG: GNAT family N-acetyltransferase [Clostridia bacterium]|nr:GNAT family N-acetyltransferase [Clostridia bacterium]